MEEPQAISMDNICLLDGSRTSSAQFNGCGSVWMDSGGNIQLMGTRNFPTGISFAFGSRTTAIGDGEYASTFVMHELRDRLQGAGCSD
ncbi:hypothetical protein F2Q68_00035207 [Brassica cretica]|uniref:Uncharacterized protein n=1 Tax=Brassica cretica TaxID=69181 RepID=A0A8S9GXJ4_BRACR|nr:hypothetical protein F2Q68_00035207 [Brassica cretica]